jgi:ArsR family transcriptional regulator
MTTRSDRGDPPLLRWLAALGDLARLRLLRLLEQHELSVGELASILQLPQSTISRHLKLLHEGGWVTRRSEGTASLYRLDASDLAEPAAGLWKLARDQLEGAAIQEDDRRKASVLAQRPTDARTFFGRLGGEWDELRRSLFGDVFTAESLLGLLGPDLVVADLGCGTGFAVELLAPIARKVIAVDREPSMLDAARKRLEGVGNVEFREGDLLGLPLGDGEVDAAFCLLVTVYLDDPAAAVAEMARVLRPGGMALIVDMVTHDRSSYLQTMGQKHLGFGPEEVRSWARSSGLEEIRYRLLRPDPAAKGPGLFASTLRKPG